MLPFFLRCTVRFWITPVSEDILCASSLGLSLMRARKGYDYDHEHKAPRHRLAGMPFRRPRANVQENIRLAFKTLLARQIELPASSKKGYLKAQHVLDSFSLPSVNQVAGQPRALNLNQFVFNSHLGELAEKASIPILGRGREIDSLSRT